VDQPITHVIQTLPVGAVRKRPCGDEETVVRNRPSAAERQAVIGGIEICDPATDPLNPLAVVDLALVRFHVASGEAVHERVHQRGAGEEVVALAADTP
jgi:hypothetical protein